MYDEEMDVNDADEVVDSGTSSPSSDSSMDNDGGRDLRTPSAKQRKLLVSVLRGRAAPVRARHSSESRRVRAFLFSAGFGPADASPNVNADERVGRVVWSTTSSPGSVTISLGRHRILASRLRRQGK